MWMIPHFEKVLYDNGPLLEQSAAAWQTTGDPLFAALVVGLAHTAGIHLGTRLHPETGRSEVNRPLARQVIDQLEMLRRKTDGNLSEEEEALLADLLRELHPPLKV